MKEQRPRIQQLQPKIDAEKAADKAAADEAASQKAAAERARDERAAAEKSVAAAEKIEPAARLPSKMRGNLIARWPGPHRVSHEDPYRAWLRFHYSDAKEKLCYIALDFDTEIERHLRALTRRRPESFQMATSPPLAVSASAAPGIVSAQFHWQGGKHKPEGQLHW